MVWQSPSICISRLKSNVYLHEVLIHKSQILIDHIIILLYSSGSSSSSNHNRFYLLVYFYFILVY